jgi:dipeptidyl aminopeptidase/acylaminoacyl peptidase
LTIEVQKSETLDRPPTLMARIKSGGPWQTIWDPNPQLSDIDLGLGQVVHWKDETGYEMDGGLLKPPGYVPNKRCPLVIQTHGFSRSQFLSSGPFTSAFAAAALAAHGIAVLQVGWNPNDFDTSREGADQVAAFQAAIQKLDQDGVIDPSRVGAIGFSRAVYHVLYTLTSASMLAAASVTDGVNFGYLEYLSGVDGGLDREANAINGGSPYGSQGIQSWLRQSPEFNMKKVRAPLLLLQPGPAAIFESWEPYAALRYMHKPVDLIMLQPGTHVMTNPIQRLAAETTNVDWFRFWLQRYERTEPVAEAGETTQQLRERYRRWEHLCDLQVQQNPKQPAFCVPSKPHQHDAVRTTSNAE